ncbi:MAG: hypothetical protein DRJ42_07745 [Deltaproteobacteria bacterium]|nr:MAG: hypothetical protein DRJ42_07745 [Deltaproteobacteria bacterium]
MPKVEAKMSRLLEVTLVIALLATVVGCDDPTAGALGPAEGTTPVVAPEPEPAPVERVDSRPPPMDRPVDHWTGGELAGQVDAAGASGRAQVLLDLGDDWTPYIFSERGNESEPVVENTYRETYLALARGEFPEDHHGDRARRDKYLELYGITPTLSLLRERFRTVAALECAESLDLTDLAEFGGFVSYRNNDRARRDSRQFRILENQVTRLLDAAGVSSVDELDTEALDTRDARRIAAYREDAPTALAVKAAQARLECEGFMEGKGTPTPGALDWTTHEALAEFERRHRVYGWGYIGRDTLAVLRRAPLENEREAVLRILTERAVHSAGFIEDGSTSMVRDVPRTYQGADGADHPIPNLEADIREAIITAFGLQTPESTLAWLDGLTGLDDPDHENVVAVDGPSLPEYYSGEMDLFVQTDRGDVWYDFPYSADGGENVQSVQRRPRLTIFTRYRDQNIPLARFGTTIGGWRSEQIDETVMWKYKNSPPGPRMWGRIVAAPVWLPPDGATDRSLLTRNPRGRGAERFQVNYHETGPSYASAYGLVAAYHQKFLETADGNIRLGGDEGIRTHGSVDYMSIMRRHSHGCHRLHNHIAVRLMSFVLAHRPHTREGQDLLSYRRVLEHDDNEYHMEINQRGYVFRLDDPLPVTVLEGRIRGTTQTPVEHPVPKWDEEVGAYLMPDGGAVLVARDGTLTPTTLPEPDGGVDADAGVPLPAEDMSAEQLMNALPL